MLKRFFQVIADVVRGLNYDSKHRYEIAEEVAKKAAEKRRNLGDRDEMIEEDIDWN